MQRRKKELKNKDWAEINEIEDGKQQRGKLLLGKEKNKNKKEQEQEKV